MIPTRNQAYDLMCEWVKSESLRKHMLCVEAVMRAYAKKYGQDDPSRLGGMSPAEAEELWGIAGLIHDFDYEKYPEPNSENKTGHPYEGVKYLESLQYPSEIIDAILGHALYSGVPRTTQMAKTLFACDELCGFLVACGHMRPDKLESLEASSVNKKLKNKNFAAKVSREDINLGVSEMAVDRDEHINFVIGALRTISKELGF
jgi:predicted hydrolase (HD superfamily)